MTTQGTTRINSSLSKGKTWQRPTLLGLRRRKCTEDLNLCSPNATTITMGSMLPSATTVRKLAIWPVTGHYKKDCPKLKNNNRVNQAGNGGATTKAYTVENVGKNPDSNVVTELGSFDVIIGMDWLAKYHAVIVCDEKIIRIPFGNEILIIHVFLAYITAKKAEDKTEKKRLEDVPIV
ncbi:reverse transcriptase domain-containing protein [Tanacetum coccineum]